MTVGSPEGSGDWFDVESEVTASDKQGMLDQLVSFKKEQQRQDDWNNWRRYARLATEMKQLQIPVEINNRDKEIMTEIFREKEHLSADCFYYLKELGIFLEINDKDKEQILTKLLSFRDSNAMWTFSQEIRGAPALGIQIEINDNHKQELLHSLSGMRKRKNWDHVALLIKAMKEMGISVELDDDDKRGMLDELENNRKTGDYYEFGKLAAAMKYLSEEHSNLDSTAIPIPEQKQF
jgi:hypothetical protein